MSYSYKPDASGTFGLFVFFVLALALLIYLTSCSSTPKKGPPLTSLCIMDFEANYCWTNKPLKRGISFEEMKKFQAECSGGIDYPCWYGLSTADVMRIGQ